jgi:hypothetical protein
LLNENLPQYLEYVNQEFEAQGVKKSLVNLKISDLQRETQAHEALKNYQFPFLSEITLKRSEDLDS